MTAEGKIILFYKVNWFNLLSFLINIITSNVFFQYDFLNQPVYKNLFVFLRDFTERSSFDIFQNELAVSSLEVFVNFLNDLMLQLDITCSKHVTKSIVIVVNFTITW